MSDGRADESTQALDARNAQDRTILTAVLVINLVQSAAGAGIGL